MNISKTTSCLASSSGDKFRFGAPVGDGVSVAVGVRVSDKTVSVGLANASMVGVEIAIVSVVLISDVIV